EGSRDGRSHGASWPPIGPLAGAQSDDTRAPSDFSFPQPEIIRDLVERIEEGDATAKYRLYEVFNRGIRFQLIRHIGALDLDDKVHDTFVIVFQAIVHRDL